MGNTSAPVTRGARNRRRALVFGGIAATAVVIAGGATFAFADTSVFSDTFESGSTSNWSKSGGTWAIGTDGTKVFQQTDSTSENARQFAGDTSWTDYAIQARVKPVAFGSGGLAGIDARVQSSTKFYRLALSSGQAQLQAVSGSTITAIATSSQTISTGTWYTLKIAVSGSTITGYVNGTSIGSGTNTSYGTGRIGLQTVYASANFDDVDVTTGGTSTTSPTATTSATATASATTSPTGGGTTTAPAGIAGYATMNGGTTGGSGGSTVTVTTLADLTTQAKSSTTEIIKVSGSFSCSADVVVASNKSVIGVGSSSGLTGCGLSMKSGTKNVIIQNMKISKVLASNGNGDAIHVDNATNIWIDHNDLSSDMNNGKDYYDGLCDITHAADYVTVSYNYFHDHYKASLVGHSDSNASEDTGHLHVTYHHNYFYNINSRTPSLRFGTGHVYNNYFVNGSTAVHSRMGAQMLVQNNVFVNVTTPIQTNVDSDVDGFVNESGNDFGGGTNSISQTGTFTTAPYSVTLTATSSVASVVTANAGTGKI